MLFIELFVPRGTLDQEQRRRLVLGLGSIRALTQGEDEEMQPESAAVFGSMFQAVVHEPELWVADERLHGPDDPPRYFVRVHVPGPWRKEMSDTIVSFVTKVIAEVEQDPRRPYRRPVVQVHVLGVAEGGIGVFGQTRTSAQLVELLNEPLQDDFAEGRAVKDPLCGALVSLDTAPTLEADGTVYGFCCKGCRTAFVERRAKAAPR